MIPIKNRKKNLEATVEEMRNFAFVYIEKYAPSKQQLRTYLLKKYLKSGAATVSKKNINSVSNYVIKNYDASNINVVDSKKFLFKSKFSGLLGRYFRLENEKYFISKEKFDGFFIVRKTGKTNNPNIIFKVQLINSHLNDDMKLFLNDLSV